MNPLRKKFQEAQTLVIVLVVLVIAAVVVTAVAYRSIKDIRLSAEKRDSALASAQIDSFLDVAMEEGFWNALWVDDGPCEDQAGGEGLACVINKDFWKDYISSETKCDDWSVSARRNSTGINSFFIGKDEVMEIDLRNADGTERAGELEVNVSWKGAASYLILKFYNEEDLDSVVALTYEGEDTENWDSPDSPDVETLPLSSSYTFAISGNDVVRIRPVAGDALISISGLADNYFQFGELKAHCYIGDVYREYISQFMLRDSAPSVLDYVLYDSTGLIGGSGVE